MTRGWPCRMLFTCAIAVVTCFTLAVCGYRVMTARRTPLLVFLSDSCGECREVSLCLDQLVAAGVSLEIHQYRSEDVANITLRRTLDTLYNVAEENRSVVPALFIGEVVLIRAEAIESNLPHILACVTACENRTLLKRLAAATASLP